MSADLNKTSYLDVVLGEFIEQAGNADAQLALFTFDYQDASSVQEIRQVFEHAAGKPVAVIELTNLRPTSIEVPEGTTGLILSAPPKSQFDTQRLQAIAEYWRSGLPVWLNGAAFSWIGPTYVYADFLIGKQEDFIVKPDQIQTGLDWVSVGLHPYSWDQNNFQILYSLAYYQPKILALGIPYHSGLKISQEGAQVWGENAVLVLNFSQANFSNGVATHGLIDFFAPQEIISFEANAQDVQSTATLTPTLPPSITPTQTIIGTATPEPTETQRIRPTATLRPTRTPMEIPPSPDPARMNLMVVITIIMVVIILFGVWLNRSWIK